MLAYHANHPPPYLCHVITCVSNVHFKLVNIYYKYIVDLELRHTLDCLSYLNFKIKVCQGLATSKVRIERKGIKININRPFFICESNFISLLERWS